MRKRIYTALAVMLTVVLGSFATTTAAHAGIFDGGGSGGDSSGGGGGGGGSYTGPAWIYLGPNLDNLTPPNGYWALTSVYDNSSYPGQGPVPVKRAMQNLQPECGGNGSSTRAVFGQAMYASNWTQWIYGVSDYWTAKGTYNTLLSAYQGRGGNDPAVIQQLSSIGGQGLPLKTVICVTNDSQFKWEEAPTYAPAKDTVSVTCTYARTTSIKRQISKVDASGKLIDPIGENNLEDQAGTAQKTPFGQLVDKYSKMNPAPPLAEAKAALDKACADSKTSTRSTVDLSAKNKAGLAEGGVLNVSEHSKDATYTATQDYEKFVSCISREYESTDQGKTWVATGKTRACTGNYPPTRNPGAVNATANILQSLNLTGFWQILAVHCNRDDFNALLAATDGEMVENTNDNGMFSAVVYSKLYKSIPAKLDFGDSTNPKAAAAKSGTLNFYDKECPFDCTAAPTGPGASAANGATSNVGNAKPATDGTVDKYGAVSGKNNTNKFEFFRDNKPHPINLDVWYPKSQGVVSYNGGAPLTTTVNRWAGGTPSLEGTEGGKFTMKTADGKDVFNTSGSVLNQRNWDPTTGTPDSAYLYSSPTSAMLKGLVRNFTVQSTWASDKDKPQVLNVKWEYAPNVSTRFATTGLGFNSDGTIARGGVQTVSTPVQGKCYAQFGTPNGLNTSSMFQANTGTGTLNGLDGKLVQGDTMNKPADDSSNLFINFVRSTTE